MHVTDEAVIDTLSLCRGGYRSRLDPVLNY